MIDYGLQVFNSEEEIILDSTDLICRILYTEEIAADSWGGERYMSMPECGLDRLSVFVYPIENQAGGKMPFSASMYEDISGDLVIGTGPHTVNVTINSVSYPVFTKAKSMLVLVGW